MKKNLLLSLRNKRATFLQLFASFFFVFFVFVVDQAIQFNQQGESAFKNLVNPPEVAVNPIPRCSLKGNRTSCFTLAYVPAPSNEYLIDPNSLPSLANLSAIQTIVTRIAANNNPAFPLSEVIGFKTAADLDTFLLANTELIQAGLLFNYRTSSSISFTIQQNSTVQTVRGRFQNVNFLIQVPLQVAAEREISRFVLNSDLAFVSSA